MSYPSRVSKVWSPTKTVRAIRIEKPEGFSFQASQAARLTLGDQVRPLSIASSPHRDHLEFAVRRSESDFKRAFFALEEGDEVKVAGPKGAFLLERDRPVVMLAAGIGITPFRSMLETIADEGIRPKATLVYANSDPSEIAFQSELDELEEQTGVRVLYTVSRAGMKTRWPHRIGRINRALLEELLTPEVISYVAGPVAFVESMVELAKELGLPEADVRLETFRGYAEDPTMNVFPNWDEMYRSERVEEMPWFYREIDPDVARALELYPVRGRALDVGMGPATQAIALAKLGFEVIGTDISAGAVELAAKRAKEEGVTAEFREDDILASRLTEAFDLILDRGCFHTMTLEQRPKYLEAITARLVQGGLLFLKCFSIEEPGEQGPRRLRPVEIEEIFQKDFEMLSIDRTIYYGTLDPMPKALFSVMRKR